MELCEETMAVARHIFNLNQPVSLHMALILLLVLTTRLS